MEKRKLNKFLFLLILYILFISCKKEVSIKNEIFSSKSITENTNLNLLLSNDSLVIFSGNAYINDIDYNILSIHEKHSNFEIVKIIKDKDTIMFEKDAIYLMDSIFDINFDDKKDLNIKYQTTNGNVIISYLFNKKNKKLNTNPIYIYNYFCIDDLSFFEIKKENLLYEFKK
nr:hypothetical protein [Flavobacterium sp.]